MLDIRPVATVSLPSVEDAFFRKIVEQASEFSIILLNEHGHVAFWNSGAERIFGHRSEEVIGSHFAFLFLPEDVELGLPERELAMAAEVGMGDDTRWHLRRDGSRVFVDGMTLPIHDARGRIAGFSKFGRDVTERYLTERRVAAQLTLTSLINRDGPFETLADEILQSVCENLGWDMGGLWTVRGDTLVCETHWHRPGADTDAVRELFAGHRLERGVGLPGDVWRTGQARWVMEFRDESRFPRAPFAERAGMMAAFAFPIGPPDRFLGVMEFFSSERKEPDQALLPVMTLIGGQIAAFMERKIAEGALRESEERFRLMSETAQDAIFTIDENSIITFCNPAVERMFGHSPEELAGKPLEWIIPERLREAHRRGIDRYLRSGERRIPWTGIELPALHKDGHEFPCEISFGEWTSGERTIFTGFARDTTERLRAREELQEALAQEQQARSEAEAARAQLQRRADEEASFRHLASALTGAIEMTEVLYEITSRATHVTRADGVYVERIVDFGGVQLVEVVSTFGRGAPSKGLRVAYPGSMTEEIMKGLAPVILADMSGLGRSMAPYLADTCERCEVLVTPLVAENEPLGALVLLNSSSSGRHFGDGDIVRARTLGDLASLALRRVRLLEQEREAKEKAEAAVRVRDETLGIVSHDLRNPLTKIGLSAGLLQEASADEQRDLIETIRSSARQMERLIQDLLDVARMESGTLSVAAERLDPEPLVREVCESNAPLAASKDQSIVCLIDSPLPVICADHDRLVQVFGNLIGNAIKFTPERGTITIEARPQRDFVEFVVRDSGPGIPEADLPLVFKPYWQAKKTAHMGAGLGLAIVRGIIKAHGGHVSAGPAPGGGALFRFTIPIA